MPFNYFIYNFIVNHSGISGYMGAAYPNVRNSLLGGKLLPAWLPPWRVYSLTRTIQPTVCRWIVFFTQELEHLTSYQLLLPYWVSVRSSTLPNYHLIPRMLQPKVVSYHDRSKCLHSYPGCGT